jgi:hypothetical protein
MRLALGTAAPVRFIAFFISQSRTPVVSRPPGAFVSATSTSPFGST